MQHLPLETLGPPRMVRFHYKYEATKCVREEALFGALDSARKEGKNSSAVVLRN